MGTILHANDDHDASDEYLLVTSGVVVDAITASYNFCFSNIINNYDYLIDGTVSESPAGIGWTYDSGNDTFSPPPEDFEAELEAALLAVDTALEAAGEAYIAASEEDRSTALGNVFSELSEEAEAEIDVMIAVSDYLATLV